MIKAIGSSNKRRYTSWKPYSNKFPSNSIVIDSKGGEEKVSLSKAEAVKELGLQPRDLVFLGKGFNRKSRPVLLARQQCFVVCMGNIKAAVKKDKILLFQSSDLDLSKYAQKISSILTNPNSDSEPFEARALELILRTIVRRYYEKSALISPLIVKVLDEIGTVKIHDLDSNLLQRLLVMKNSISEFEIDATLSRNCIYEVLQNDEDLELMMLTRNFRMQQSPFAEETETHQEVELILENYVSQFVDIAQEAYYLRKRIESTMSVIELQLDSYRNDVLRTNLVISISALSLSFCTAVTGFFGMNLINHMETHPYMFFYISTSATCSVLCMFSWLIYKTKNTPNLLGPNIAEKSIFSHLDETQFILNYASASKKFNRKDFKKALEQRAGVDIGDEDLEVLYSTFDIDKDGKIDSTEVKARKTSMPE